MRWIVVALVVASCNPPLSDRQYCVKRQMAWESAFPAVKQTDAQREQFVQTCLSTIAAKHASGEFDRSVACFAKTITGRGHATEEYLAFERCEAAK
jgi:hypothetical protein